MSTFVKRWWCMAGLCSVSVFALWAYVQLSPGEAVSLTLEPGQRAVSRVEAVMATKSAFRERTNYRARMGLKRYETEDCGDFWKVYQPGQINNQFGAIVDVVAVAQVPKATDASRPKDDVSIVSDFKIVKQQANQGGS